MSADTAPAIDRDKLAKLLGMFSSDFDGEVVAAACAAEALLRRAGRTWAEILATRALPAPPRRQPVDDPDDHRDHHERRDRDDHHDHRDHHHDGHHRDHHHHDQRDDREKIDVRVAIEIAFANRHRLLIWEAAFIETIRCQRAPPGPLQTALLERIARKAAAAAKAARPSPADRARPRPAPPPPHKSRRSRRKRRAAA